MNKKMLIWIIVAVIVVVAVLFVAFRSGDDSDSGTEKLPSTTLPEDSIPEEEAPPILETDEEVLDEIDDTVGLLE